MTRLLAAASVAALMPAAAHAQSAEEMRDTVIAAMSGEGCRMSLGDADRVFGGAGLEREATRPVLEAMMEDGIITLDLAKGSATLLEPHCGGAAEGVGNATPKSELANVLMGVFEANGCALGQDEAASLMLEQGYTQEQVEVAAEVVDDMGGFGEGDDGRLRLTAGAACGDEDAVREAEARGTMVSIFEQHGCALTRNQADEYFAAAGLDRERDGGAMRSLISMGMVEVDREAGVARLIEGEVCGGTVAEVETSDAGEGATEAATAPDPLAPLALVLVENGCRLSDGELMRAMRDAGHGRDALDAMGEALEASIEGEEGRFAVEEDPQTKADTIVLIDREACE